ncbi:MAG: TraR/DksA C4-type zinc finger protein [Desulfobacterales bacterium]|nr:TraR/DksA C4-type zinc finger protein [Desulfobacterales bacterium]
MNAPDFEISNIPDDLKRCTAFHGHLCPGLVYGYRVAKEAMALLKIERSYDEEVVAIPENDSCAIDALQVLLGTTRGKGNLIIKNYGKNAYVVINRTTEKKIRFVRKSGYVYQGKDKAEFDRLEKAVYMNKATESEIKKQKRMKAADLLLKPFDEIFTTRTVEDYEMPLYASLAPSKACARCGELTMETRMVNGKNDRLLCIPCAEEDM